LCLNGNQVIEKNCYDTAEWDQYFAISMKECIDSRKDKQL